MAQEFYTRIINKHDTEANWNNNSSFIPEQGELIVYDIDSNYNFQRIKMGDGVTTVGNLPFINIADARFDEIMSELEEIKGLAATGGSLQEISATPGDVLSGKTYNDSEGKVQVGTMTNNGAVSQTLSVNGTYTIPAGYHNGSGKVTQSLTTKAATTYGAKTSDQTIAAGQYLSGAQTIKKVEQSGLTAANIVKGQTITVKSNGSNLWSVSGSNENRKFYELGTFAGNATVTCTSVSGYANLTLDNFILYPVAKNFGNGGNASNCGVVLYNNSSYAASTGKLTCKFFIRYSTDDFGNYRDCYPSVKVYCVI